jgi:hypothetical protein
MALELQLDELELALMLDPDAIEKAFERACIFGALGRIDEAMPAYYDVLRRRPDHFGALNNLAVLLTDRGMRRSALHAYTLLVERHPDSAIAHTHLASILHAEGRSDEAVAHYERALALDSTAASAHHGLATIFSERGDEQAATRERRLGYKHRPVSFGRFRGEGEPVRLLVLGVDGEGNVPTKSFFDDRIFAIASLIVGFYDGEKELPPHDLVFNAIGDADRCALELTAANTLLARTTVPVVNPPSKVLVTGRVANGDRMGALPDVIAPRFGIFPRWLLDRSDAAAALAASGFEWPLLLRAPGYHTGQHFLKVNEPDATATALASLPGTAVIAIAFLDSRNSDGAFRKYRIITVGGAIYPLHLAVSNDWKVHYFSADMVDNPQHRAEDAAFLEDPRGTIGARAYAALEQIVATLDLDYGGVDFSIDADGRVVLFEANATMIVQRPPAEAMWDYRRKPVERIIVAVQTMLRERAQGGLAVRD